MTAGKREPDGDAIRPETSDHTLLVLRAIRNVNQLIVREKDRDRLLQRACEILIGTRGYFNAWIALVDGEKRLTAHAEAGLGPAFEPMANLLRAGRIPECAARALFRPGVVVVRAPASDCGGCPLAGFYEDRGGLCAQLEHGDEVFGFLTVSVPSRYIDDEYEHSLLCEVAGDIAFALHGIELEADRRRAEEAQARAAREWQRTFDATQDAIWILDASQRILRCNRTAREQFGRDGADLVGRRCWEVVHETEGPIPPCPFLRAKRSLKRETMDLQIGDRWFEITVDPIVENGRCTAAVHIAKDITERIRSEEERSALREQFLQSQKMEAIGRLAGGIAHDFNNLMTIVTGLGELQLDCMEPGDPKRSDLEEMVGAAKRASDLTRQLLAFSRRRIGRPEVLDLGAVIASMSKMLERLIGEDVALVFATPPGPWLVSMDRGQIEQVLFNFAVNARDAMPVGGELTITLGETRLDAETASGRPGLSPGRYVSLTVRDTGAGMDEKTRTRAFEPFFTTKAEGKGTGLGLSTVYGIVTQCGGSVEVRSAPGRGTAFDLLLPRAEGEAKRPRPTREIRRARGGRETILVVEDDDAVRTVVEAMLARSGYAVLTAGTGAEALRLCAERGGRIDLLLSDVVMPGMSGPALVERLREIGPDLSVLFMSGYAGGETQQLEGIGPDAAFLEKPFTHEALTEKVREALNGPGEAAEDAPSPSPS